ncbi:hypothetical protein MCHI_001258 [Candidatus Magnetoovum chiemensis]|nr:hypothetical protein MCHI_001258 [Candidatus Magnetoovum chiemensis]
MAQSKRETDEEIKRIFAEIRQIAAERAEESRKVDKKIKETAKIVNNLTTKWGHFVEGMVLPATKRIFNERGIELKQIHQMSISEVEGAQMEIDILATNGEYAVAVEIKSTLGLDDVKYHID